MDTPWRKDKRFRIMRSQFIELEMRYECALEFGSEEITLSLLEERAALLAAAQAAWGEEGAMEVEYGVFRPL